MTVSCETRIDAMRSRKASSSMLFPVFFSERSSSPVLLVFLSSDILLHVTIMQAKLQLSRFESWMYSHAYMNCGLQNARKRERRILRGQKKEQEARVPQNGERGQGSAAPEVA